MIKLVFCVKRRPDIAETDFYDYWLNQHGPLVKSKAQDLNIARYVQSHTTSADLGSAISSARGLRPDGYDGIAELWWDDLDSLLAGTDSDAGQEASRLLAEDEARFIDMEASTIFFTREHEVMSSV